jgi:hypothetical protein
LLTLAAIVALAAVGYGAATQLVDMPLVNPDELRYTLAARAVADGEWLNLRGHSFGYGPVYPLLLAPIVAISGTIDAAYPYFRLANAVFFALAALPIYLLARRLLSPWWSVGATAMSVAIPSSIYTSLVLTESASYFTVSIAMLAMVLTLEHPSVRRQLAMLSTIGLAYATRPQFAVLVPAFLGGAALVWAVDPRRPRFREAVARLWPTLGAVALAAGAFLTRLAFSSTSLERSLGGYGDLWRGYDLGSVARLVVYHLAGWEIYLFVVPFVVAPVVVVELLRDVRRGGRREGAFVAAFLAVNAVLVVVAAAFASTPYGYSEVHDRYLFYIAPLWFVLFGVWLSRGLPRPVVWIAIGAVLAVVLAAVLPFGMVGGSIVFEAVPTALWSWVWTAVEGTPHVDGRRALGATVVVLTVAAVAVPRRAWPVLPVLVAAGLVLTSVLAWNREHDAPAAFVFADNPTRAWVDDAVANGARTTKLYLSSERCPYTEMTRHAFFLTEFFNSSVDRVAAIGDSISDGLPSDGVHVGPGGRFLLADGNPLFADYVLTQPGIQLAGRPIARGTGARLVLWETRGPVRLADARLRTGEIVTAECR